MGYQQCENEKGNVKIFGKYNIAFGLKAFMHQRLFTKVILITTGYETRLLFDGLNTPYLHNTNTKATKTI